MNARKARQIHQRTRELLVEWVKSLLPEEEAERVSLSNIHNLLPAETHFFANNKIHLNSYSFKWIKKGIKRVLRQEPKTNIKDITMEQIKCSLQLPAPKQHTPYRIL